MATHDRRVWKKCIKCRQWKRREPLLNEQGEKLESKGFGANRDSNDGLQSICMSCKHTMNTASRNRNVTARIRHHTGTRCLTQLGEHAPPNFVKDLETYLGYSIRQLVRHLSHDLKSREGKRRKLVDALNEGYHIDHIHPLSRFGVVVGGEVSWEEFKRCWDPMNLRAIPAEENLAKGAKII